MNRMRCSVRYDCTMRSIVFKLLVLYVGMSTRRKNSSLCAMVDIRGSLRRVSPKRSSSPDKLPAVDLSCWYSICFCCSGMDATAPRTSATKLGQHDARPPQIVCDRERDTKAKDFACSFLRNSSHETNSENSTATEGPKALHSFSCSLHSLPVSARNASLRRSVQGQQPTQFGS